MALVRPTMTSRLSCLPVKAAFILPTPSAIGIRFGRLARQRSVLDRQRRDASGLQLLDGAFDAERVAVAMVGVDQQRQFAGPIDPIGLLQRIR